MRRKVRRALKGTSSLTQIKVVRERDRHGPRMKTWGFRFVLAVLLAVSIGAGGALADAAHSAAMSGRDGATEIVICASDGSTETILVDGTGNPVEPRKQCPAAPCDDCLPAAMNAIPVSAFALAVGFQAGCGASPSPLRLAEKSRMGSNPARAPPTGELTA